MAKRKPVEVAIIGGGCASIAAAFELTQPRHRGRYHVTIYQQGWRLGGKGASGRGAAGRIEEHGLHVWLGCYDNAFWLLRQCYNELNRIGRKKDRKNWRDLFLTDSHLAVAGHSAQGGWVNWAAVFPPAPGIPGDPLDAHNPFTVKNYLARAIALLRTLLLSMETFRVPPSPNSADASYSWSLDSAALVARITSLLRYGVLSSAAVAVEALAVVEAALKSIPAVPVNAVLQLIEAIAATVRRQLEQLVASDDHIRYQWEIIDLVVANLIGAVRFGLLTDPRGLDAIDHLDHRQWLRLNGASERAINSPFTRILYDMTFAYEDGDANRPAIAASAALRGTLRFFFCYRGALFWKMRAGMGDVVFAPFYEVLRRRGVTFKFFHRLQNIKLAKADQPGGKRYVEALELDVQAEILGGREYRPLIEVCGMRCWPAKPDFRQLRNGTQIQREGWQFESHWEHRKSTTRELRVMRDFDFVVLGVSIGALPYVCREILAADERWQAMVENVKTVATQAFQLWLSEDLQELGWESPPVTLTSFVKPFDTWADMGHVIPAENWRNPPRTAAYFCNVLGDPPHAPHVADRDYPRSRRAEVRANAIAFLNRDIEHLWPKAMRRSGEFCWELLVDAAKTKGSRGKYRGNGSAGSSRFDTQFWTANINPSDRYVLALPGSSQYRISPLDNTYDNLTIAGDWTDCGLNVGCVEAAAMSGRLAAHAIAGWPALEDIIGYDHP